MGEAPRTHMIEFSASLLLTACPCQYRLVSKEASVPDGSRRVEAGISFRYRGQTLTFHVAPMFHTDLGRVQIFWRRQNQKEHSDISKLKLLLQDLGIYYKQEELRR